MSWRRLWLLLALGVAPSAALAEERYDHRGAVGLLVVAGGDGRNASGAGEVDNGVRADLGLGGTLALTDRVELMVEGRASLGGSRFLPSVLGGVRSAYALDRWRTFLDLGAAAHFGPLWTVGPRIAFGVQYEVLPVVGIFSSLGAELGWGAGLRILGELTVGVQFRSYLLE